MIILIIILIILLIIAISYLLLLKISINKLNNDLNKKINNKSNIILTSNISDKDLNKLINTINNSLKDYQDIQNEYETKSNNLQKMMMNISHDLRTPLTSALGYIDIILKSDIKNKEEVKNLKIIEDRLKRLSELIDSFFMFSKIISNSDNIVLDDVNIIAVLEKAISNHYEDFSNSKRIINFKTNKRKIIIKSNELMLSRIFDNLIRNAFIHSLGNLDINVYSDKTLVISFSNDLLYPSLDIDRIFDEFYTVDISRTKGHTGLGLAIAKEFVLELNGKIEAKKINNKLTITIEFNI